MEYCEDIIQVKSFPVPPYLERADFMPEKLDFGDGGAYPEILTLQYPLDMGRDSRCNVANDAIVRKNENRSKFLYIRHINLFPKVMIDKKVEIISKCDFERVTRYKELARKSYHGEGRGVEEVDGNQPMLLKEQYRAAWMARDAGSEKEAGW